MKKYCVQDTMQGWEMRELSDGEYYLCSEVDAAMKRLRSQKNQLSGKYSFLLKKVRLYAPSLLEPPHAAKHK